MMPDHHTSSRHKVTGFTLIELLMVLTIAGLLMTITPPLISAAFPAVELKAAARRTASALRIVRETAIGRGQEQTWWLNVDTGTYGITEQPERDGQLPDGLLLRLVTASDEVVAGAEQVGTIRFFADGSSTGGRVLLGYENGTGYQVGVDWLTGRIEIADWTPE
jgi:general secretion pathway protein H